MMLIELKKSQMSEELQEGLNDACQVGKLEIVISLVSQGTDIHANEDIAVRWASLYGHLDVVKYLVSQGANVCAYNDDAVRWASANGHLDVVRYLVFQGVNIHAENDEAVRWASYFGHLDVVRYLLSQGANIHADNDLAVRVASGNGLLEAVAHLVSLGAPTTHISEFHRRYATIYMKHYKRRKIRAASRIYFWWIRRCYPLSHPSGIRMAYWNLQAYETMCSS